MSHELRVVIAPADGQWFNELPIPWVYTVWPPDTGPPPDPVPGSMGWTREEAIVTVNGQPTDSEWTPYQRMQVWLWRTVDGLGDPYDWETGANTLVFEASFSDGVVIEESRSFHYDPSLKSFTGWMVELDQDTRTITFAASTYESAEEDGADTGPVTSVIEYRVRDDAAFILLGVDSGGQPPPSAISFEEFADLTTRAQTGDCQDCFFAAWADTMFSPPDSEPGGKSYFVMYLRDDEVLQLEQIWIP